jgi:hypothetical protein
MGESMVKSNYQLLYKTAYVCITAYQLSMSGSGHVGQCQTDMLSNYLLETLCGGGHFVDIPEHGSMS